jgi:hypothetical protein
MTSDDVYKEVMEIRSQINSLKVALEEKLKIYNILVGAEQRKRTSECKEHHYIPTNTKWQPINQVRCQFCGDEKN